jgi:hypothetical protein
MKLPVTGDPGEAGVILIGDSDLSKWRFYSQVERSNHSLWRG